jgi:hypothetical protein
MDVKNSLNILKESRILSQVQDYSSDSYADDADVTSKWNSKLTEGERLSYKKMINLKNSFAASLPYLPQFFQPEDPKYLEKVFQIMINFFYFVGSIAFLILIYLVLRFCCKKCQGPTKMSQITRSYINYTWIILSKF